MTAHTGEQMNFWGRMLQREVDSDQREAELAHEAMEAERRRLGMMSRTTQRKIMMPEQDVSIDGFYFGDPRDRAVNEFKNGARRDPYETNYSSDEYVQVRRPVNTKPASPAYAEYLRSGKIQ